MVHFELVPDGRAVNAELYNKQLERVYNILTQRYPTLIRRKRALLQHDNAPAHRADLTKEKLDELDGIVALPHPAYSPDLTSSDYGLFRSMAHFSRGRRFETLIKSKQRVANFLSSRSVTGIEIRFGNLQNAGVRSLRMMGCILKNDCYWF